MSIATVHNFVPNREVTKFLMSLVTFQIKHAYHGHTHTSWIFEWSTYL